MELLLKRLGVLAAEHEQNATNIGLVGLADTGLQYLYLGRSTYILLLMLCLFSDFAKLGRGGGYYKLKPSGFFEVGGLLYYSCPPLVFEN